MSELFPELLDRCRRGDAQAAASLIQRFHDYASSLAVALLEDRHLAEDAVQNAMVTMLQRLTELKDPAAFPGWLRQIVRTEANRLRRRRRPASSHEFSAEPDTRRSPTDEAQMNELRRRVRDALASLPPAGRQTAQLYYLDEIDQIEVARSLNVPLGTVKRRLHDARRQLRELLRDLPL